MTYLLRRQGGEGGRPTRQHSEYVAIKQSHKRETCSDSLLLWVKKSKEKPCKKKDDGGVLNLDAFVAEGNSLLVAFPLFARSLEREHCCSHVVSH